MTRHPRSPISTRTRTRIRLATASVLPTLITVPLCAALAAAGALPWAVLPAVVVALTVQGWMAYVRLGVREITGPAPGGSGPRR
ncbi:hypothetical protein ACFYWU_20010 [Streptomyces chrestomyceticus]|uniref:hypothetical protein n=1 Tax=Streptomyces chrestomyceticus TaxID=68185 RepID=UPI0036A31E05